MNDTYRDQSLLAVRYASPLMVKLWSAEHRARLWRRLWLALAEEQQRLGVAIPPEAISQMKQHLDDVDLAAVESYERRLRHDVMAHIHHFGDQAPAARPYIHLGATSAYVTDNADLILLRDSLKVLLGRLVALLEALRDFALRYRSLPTVAYTHFQPAQLTTVGKRAALWLQDFALDAADLSEAFKNLPFRGCKGTTGTQASFLELFDGDHEKVRQLDRAVAATFGFTQVLPLTGQTYTRKIDSRLLDRLSGVAQSASKFATDIRLLQHEGEILEPVETEQVGSSAMPYKRNPVRSERICALSRYLMSLRENAAHTAANQWLERSLDDSANRRLVLPQAMQTADAILMLMINVARGLEVKERTIRSNVEKVMPFMATERWLVLGVRAGGDRQELHELIRRHSREVAARLESGGPNDLLERLALEPAFSRVPPEALRQELSPERYVGRAPEQVQEYVAEHLDPLLDSLRSFQAPVEEEVKV